MRYSTGLADKQWAIIREILPKENRVKHLQCHSKRELINAVLYLNKTGCQWRIMPKDFPNYKTVSSFYQRTVKSGLWVACIALALLTVLSSHSFDTKTMQQYNPSLSSLDDFKKRRNLRV